MSVNPDTELRDRSCAPCNSSALGISCCGLCAFWVRRPQFRSTVQYLVSLLNSSLFKDSNSCADWGALIHLSDIVHDTEGVHAISQRKHVPSSAEALEQEILTLQRVPRSQNG